MKSIKHKILIFAMLATLVPSIGLGVLLLWRYQAVLTAQVEHELHTAADDARGELAMWLRERVNDVRAVSTAYVLIDGLTPANAQPPTRPAIGPAEVALYLRSVQSRIAPILELTVSKPDGDVLASSALRPFATVLPQQWRDAAITEGLVLEPARWDVARETATVTVVVPVLSTKSELIGALSAVLDLQALRPRLQEATGPSSAEIILIGPDGKPLLSTQSRVSGLEPLPAEPLELLRTSGGEPRTFTGHHQREVLGLAAPLRSLPLTVVVERDRSEIFAPWLATVQLFLALAAALAASVGVIGYWIGRSIAKPIDGLIVAADGIANGDLNVSLAAMPPDEVGRLTRTFNMMTDRLRRRSAAGEADRLSLQVRNQMLEVAAVTDVLTGLYNRNKLNEALQNEFQRFRRHGRAFAVVMLDVDNFKSINDTYGHGMGDTVLAHIGSVLRGAVRNVDFAARYGGEEFVVVLVETEFDVAVGVAERIRAEVQTARFPVGNNRINVTLSSGVAQVHQADDTAESALERADRALYEAKRAGRNQVHCLA